MFYIVRRLLYFVPILIGVNFITFALFFLLNSPDDMARFNLGQKHVSQSVIENWKKTHGYDKPLFINHQKSGWEKWRETIFFEKSLKLFVLDFGYSESGRDINHDIAQRMWPSLALAIPSLGIGLMVNISVALLIVFFRHTYLEPLSVMVLIILMSISGLFYIITGQYLMAKLMKLVPISGYVPGYIKFLILPVLIAVVSAMGAGARWYRALFLEEINKEYVRCARARGLKESVILFKHVLKNALIPIVTGIVVLLPLLFIGSLISESFFAIPGLGSYTIEAIHQQDFAIVQAMVFLGACLYMVGLLLTDITYTLVDPRVRLT